MALAKKQYEAIQLLLYSDMQECAICEQLEINPSTLWRWKQNEEFTTELEAENRRKFRSLQKEALQTLERLLKEGNFNAAKYILDGNDYAPTERQSIQMDAKIEVDYGED